MSSLQSVFLTTLSAGLNLFTLNVYHVEFEKERGVQGGWRIHLLVSPPGHCRKSTLRVAWWLNDPIRIIVASGMKGNVQVMLS